jgi:tRNA (guanine37-N1)-methyltransferase
MRTPQLNFRLASMQDQTMFRPPVNRAMKVLDRAFFQKTVPTSAARIYRHNDLSTYKKKLQSSKDEVNLPRYKSIQPDPVEETARAGGKCIVLRPEIKHDGSSHLTVICILNAG